MGFVACRAEEGETPYFLFGALGHEGGGGGPMKARNNLERKGS